MKNNGKTWNYLYYQQHKMKKKIMEIKDRFYLIFFLLICDCSISNRFEFTSTTILLLKHITALIAN